MEQYFDIDKHLREDLELASPSPDFSKKVMGAVAGTRIAPASRTYISKKVVYGTGLFFLLLILGTLAYALSSFEWPAAARSLPSFDPGKPDIDISQLFTRKTLNGLLCLNVLLALIFLDKYLTRRPRML